ncbi:MAG: hypothetical protein CL483_08135 [Acidobacteria bacterium]|nr:hypothetical protein [Acidobacteriota bacterium]
MSSTERQPPIPVPANPAHRPAVARSAVVTSIGRGVHIVGQVTASEHLIIEGTIDGDVVLPDHGVAIGGTGRVNGDVCAQTITVLGQVQGRLTASAIIELRSSSNVSGRVCSPNLSIEEGARFQGTVDPTRANATMAVARHRQLEVAPTAATKARASGSVGT